MQDKPKKKKKVQQKTEEELLKELEIREEKVIYIINILSNVTYVQFTQENILLY